MSAREWLLVGISVGLALALFWMAWIAARADAAADRYLDAWSQAEDLAERCNHAQAAAEHEADLLRCDLRDKENELEVLAKENASYLAALIKSWGVEL